MRENGLDRRWEKDGRWDKDELARTPVRTKENHILKKRLRERVARLGAWSCAFPRPRSLPRRASWDMNGRKDRSMPKRRVCLCALVAHSQTNGRPQGHGPGMWPFAGQVVFCRCYRSPPTSDPCRAFLACCQSSPLLRPHHQSKTLFTKRFSTVRAFYARNFRRRRHYYRLPQYRIEFD
jgi:hypothetical protein